MGANTLCHREHQKETCTLFWTKPNTDRDLWIERGVGGIRELVKLGLVLKGGCMKCLFLLTVPSICEPLTCQPVFLCQHKFEHSQDSISQTQQMGVPLCKLMCSLDLISTGSWQLGGSDKGVRIQ